jgi:hypothetical protein
MRAIWTVVILGTLVALPACASRNQISETDSSAPTVSYHYDDDEDYDRVLERAEAHCSDNYGRDAVLINRDRDGDDYEATFRCED